MKQLVGTDIGTYTFTADTKTVVISGITGMTTTKERLLIITNVTTGKILFLFNDPSTKLTSWTYNSAVSPVTLTLVLNAGIDTTGMADTDRLQIYVETSRLNNPFMAMPRGHMLNATTKRAYENTLQYPGHSAGFVDLCLKTNYPTSTVIAGANNNYANGFNIAMDSAVSLSSPNNHGVYVAPGIGRTYFIDNILLAVELANPTDLVKEFNNGQSLQMNHSGMVYSDSTSLASIAVMADDIHLQDSMFTAHFPTYFLKIKSIPAGAFNGTNGNYFQIKTSDSKPLDSDYISRMYLHFQMWEVSQ